ncbi:hypothetical protein GGQ72_004619 [Rhizobium rhizoryzae]|uniref:Uncharacterized protein n=1 Tax=Rhizobium rhizoryzae TaxID=451876 RepID=A0A7W6PS90_9HYPH|nr:hypothetical protein [Rhizobium rhizoryzae]
MPNHKSTVKPSPGNRTITGMTASGERCELPATSRQEWKPRKVRIGSVSVPYISMQIAERNDRARKQGVSR